MWLGRSSTSKFCIDNPLTYTLCSIFMIIIMLKYDMRRVGMVPFNCLHDSILKNAKSLCHPPLYLAYVTHAMGSHTTPQKNFTTSMFNCLTHMMSLELDWNQLILVSSLNPPCILDSPILMMLSKFQLAMHILGSEQWILLLLWWSKTCFMKCTPHRVGPHYHIQVLTLSIPHVYNII